MIQMYDCSKINRITVMYASQGPGTFAGDKRKILGPEESRAICEEANSRKISIEMLLKAREHVESVVINTIVPFPQAKAEVKEESVSEAKEPDAPAQEASQ